MRTTSLRLNTGNFFEKSSLLFESKTSVFTELAQNGMRANATLIDFNVDTDGTVFYADNGTGIPDLDVLFDKAESHWEDETVQEQIPYGLGFLSCLANSERFMVGSAGQLVEGNSQHALTCGELTIRDWHYFEGTQIQLSGVELSSFEDRNGALQIDRIKRLFRGFPVQVRVNGQRCANDHRVTEDYEVVEGIGRIYNVFENGDVGHLEEAEIYLNGQLVQSRTSTRRGLRAVIHLDPGHYAAVMPDRARLQADAYLKLKDAYKAWREATLINYLNSCDFDTRNNAEWVRVHYQSMCDFGLLSLINDVDWLPDGVVKRLWNCSMTNTGDIHYTPYDMNWSRTAVSRNDVVASGAPVLPRSAFDAVQNGDAYCCDTEMARAAYHQALEAWVIRKELHEDHWACKLAAKHDSEAAVAIDAEFYGDEPFIGDIGEYKCEGRVALITNLHLDGQYGRVEYDHPLCAYVGEALKAKTYDIHEVDDLGAFEEQITYFLRIRGGRIDKGDVYRIVEFANSYLTEHDHYDDSALYRDTEYFMREWSGKLISTKGVEQVIAHFMGEHRGHLAEFAGEKVTLIVDESGNLKAA
ncbi:hypothetical protein A3709_20785 [Halioglobus sp. HI00S01]|uniref:hypothetical protein n=1 Tax=Halioglobus sp. HI00S01 TaxID=1822214 RepID=UPI0007C3E0AD|nr:hypothetical protein [Halioglobus sp. HI00S01]KZX58051.1 hypothetical protein A3709_20785 [Halioglobus sp. HI00S01]